MMCKTILVTGSSKGLGLAIAKDLSKHGFSVVLNARDEKSVDKALTYLNQDNPHYAFCYDLTKQDSVGKLDTYLQKEKIQIDGIVHNLGGKIANDMQPLHVKTLHKSMRLNLEVAIEINNYLIPQMIQRGGGAIVHIGSSSGLSGNAAPAYAISKGALNTYVKNSARYYAKDGVCICSVVPGILDHEGSEWDKKSKLEPKKYEDRKMNMPLQRFGKPEEIAPFVTAIFTSKSMQVAGSILYFEGGI
ncbi:MAG TPA: short-chain dehydrogenase [Sulfurospirillum sp. UBA11407]|nr:MAG TPA: short-chain dehydrogenase [Sulfurospirillum sp. UBA11407]